MPKDSIRLHPEHGLNPTIPICAWCGEARNEIVMLGAAYKGEAPMHMLVDMVPCDKCKEVQAHGITFFYIDLKQGISYWAVVTEESAKRMLSHHAPDILEKVLQRRMCQSTLDFCKHLVSQYKTLKTNAS